MVSEMLTDNFRWQERGIACKGNTKVTIMSNQCQCQSSVGQRILYLEKSYECAVQSFSQAAFQDMLQWY